MTRTSEPEDEREEALSEAPWNQDEDEREEKNRRWRRLSSAALFHYRHLGRED